MRAVEWRCKQQKGQHASEGPIKLSTVLLEATDEMATIM